MLGINNRPVVFACLITIAIYVLSMFVPEQGENKSVGETFLNILLLVIQAIALYAWLYFIWGKDRQYTVNTSLIWAYFWRYWAISFIFTIAMFSLVKMLSVNFSQYSPVLVVAIGMVVNMIIMLAVFGVNRKEKIMWVVSLVRGY